MAKKVLSGLVTAWRLAGRPISRSPSSLKATIDGVVRTPSAFSITFGAPPSMTATHELVVPRSIPMTFDIRLILSVRQTVQARVAPGHNRAPCRRDTVPGRLTVSGICGSYRVRVLALQHPECQILSVLSMIEQTRRRRYDVASPSPTRRRPCHIRLASAISPGTFPRSTSRRCWRRSPRQSPRRRCSCRGCRGRARR